jgi:hypothetical protein
MFWTQADTNGLKILKKCISFFTTFHVAFMFLILTVLLNLSFYFSFLYFIYLHYGIHIFDPNSLLNFLELSLWRHIQNIIFFILFFNVCYFLTVVIIVGLTQSIIQQLEKKSPTFLGVLKKSFKKSHQILILSNLLVLDRCNKVLDVVLIQGMIHKLIAKLQGRSLVTQDIIHSSEGMLLLPLLVTTNNSIPEILNSSEEMMSKTFSKPLSVNISFTLIRFILSLIITGIFGVSLYYNYNLLPAIVISLSLAFIAYDFMDGTVILFKICLYFYIKKRPKGPFTAREIPLYFKK